jgi:hypothetical protein
MQPAAPRRTSIALAMALAVTAPLGCAGVPPTDQPTPGPSGPSASDSPVATATPTGTPDVTFEPTPSPSPIASQRTSVQLEEEIIDRPDVPESLRGTYWWSGTAAGPLGTTARITLPDGEQILDVSAGVIVSDRRTSLGEVQRTLLARDVATGALLREIETGLFAVDARVVDRVLIWTGMATVDTERNETTDGGVWTARLDGGEPAAIVAGGAVEHTIFAGRNLLLSPSRRTLAAVMQASGPGAFVDVIDVETATRSHRLDDVWPWAITDDAFLQWDMQPSDFMAPGYGITAYDLSTGDVRWRFPGKSDVDRFAPYPVFATSAGFVMGYFWRGDDESEQFVHAVFDPRTGKRRELLRERNDPRDWFTARPKLSNGSYLVLARDHEAGNAWRFATLDVETTVLTEDVVTIEPPMECDAETCWRP